MARKRAHGEGSVYRDPRGFWRGAVTMPDGRRRYVSAKTRAEAAIKVQDLATAARKGTAAADGQTTIAAFLADWLEGVRLRVRDSTYRSYSAATRNHLVPNLGRLRLVDLTTGHVTRMLSGMSAAGLKPSTVAGARMILRNAIESAVRQGALVRNVVTHARAPQREPIPRVWLDTAGGRRFLAACREDPDGPILAATLLLGLRPGEVRGLRWGDVSLDRSTVEIRRSVYRRAGQWVEGPPKTAAGRRTLPLSAPALEILAAERARLERPDPAAPVFLSQLREPYGRKRLINALLRILAAAGLPPMRLHDLRHSTASILLEQGIPIRVVADLLGHASVTTTLVIYTHVAARLVGSATDAMGALAGPIAAPPAAPPPAPEADNARHSWTEGPLDGAG